MKVYRRRNKQLVVAFYCIINQVASVYFGIVALLKYRVSGSKIAAGIIAVLGIFLPWGTFSACAMIVALFEREPQPVAAIPEQENALA